MSDGFGVNIFRLFGSSEGSAKYEGRKIVAAELTKGDGRPSCGEPGEELLLTFDDGAKISIRDEGQSCCESRYITTDDDLSKIVGGKLKRIESKAAPDKERGEDDWGDHEMCFVEVGTDECFITICTHNEHNGYYGGFALAIKEVTPADGGEKHG